MSCVLAPLMAGAILYGLSRKIRSSRQLANGTDLAPLRSVSEFDKIHVADDASSKFGHLGTRKGQSVSNSAPRAGDSKAGCGQPCPA